MNVPKNYQLSTINTQLLSLTLLIIAVKHLLDQLGQLEGINQTQTSIVLSRKIDRRSALPSVS